MFFVTKRKESGNAALQKCVQMLIEMHSRLRIPRPAMLRTPRSDNRRLVP